MNHTSVPLSLWLLGVLTPGEEGRRLLEHCYEVAESADIRSYCLNPLAGKVAAEDPERAQRLIAQSLELAESSGDGFSEVRVWQQAIRVAWAAEHPEQALARSDSALGAIENLRDRQRGGSPAQAGLFSLWSDDYAWLAGRLLKEAGRGLGRDRAVREAFRVSERMRARALMDWLRRAADREAVTEDTTDVVFAGLEQVRAVLEPHEALLSFQVAPWEDLTGDFGGGSWLLVVTGQGAAVFRRPGRVDVRSAVEQYEGLIERRDGREAEVAVVLYDGLLAPALANLPPEVQRLILIPDDALHRLPFAALRAAPEAEPLGLRYELVQAPSATLWLRWREESQKGDRPVEHPILVLADPVLPSEEAGEDDERFAQVQGVGAGLGRLPYARREGRAAVRRLGGGLLLTGVEASEEAFTGFDLGAVGMVHFAAHAVSDEDRPERSAVLLAPGGAHDGVLQSAEIAGLAFHGGTVVLASCRSASGAVLRGEGVMSLARAFFQGGAHGVVASLWPLRDDESAVQFGRFYRHLAEGSTIAGALREVRREAVAAGEPAAAWAGLVVLGDGTARPVSGERGVDRFRLWPAAAATSVLLGLAVWLVARRLRHV
ncbi:MAG TPA: CHAT domain-containing protein [Thermoanaerobaculia bacterium]|nr:CHAT domain-containing protein [Thermoanaerobaculia bacterium]